MYSVVFWLNMHSHKGRPTNSDRKKTSFSNGASVYRDPWLLPLFPSICPDAATSASNF